jgi:hypothetical protein
VEAIAASIEAPVSRRPQRALPGGSDPYSRNPVVAGGSIAPATRCPHVIRRRSGRLIVSRQRRRRLLGFEFVIAGFVVLGISLRIVIDALGRSLLRIRLLPLLLVLLLILLLVWWRSAGLGAGLLILLRSLNALVLHS